MFKLSRIALAACALGVIAPPAAIAADIAPPVYQPPPPPIVGGWYLRGDIGYKIYVDPDVNWDDSVAGLDFDDEELDDTGLIGAGVGYRFNQWFRADVTVDYEWPADFDARTPCPAPCGGAGDSVNIESGEFSAVTALANIYVDAGNWNGISPYVGGGIGAAYLMMDDIFSENGDGSTIDGGDADDWSFAWALMAGVAWEFTPGFAVDLGYRYLNLGDLESDTIEAGAGDGSFNYDDLQAHEVRLGVRYTMY